MDDIVPKVPPSHRDGLEPIELISFVPGLSPLEELLAGHERLAESDVHGGDHSGRRAICLVVSFGCVGAWSTAPARGMHVVIGNSRAKPMSTFDRITCVPT